MPRILKFWQVRSFTAPSIFVNPKLPPSRSKDSDFFPRDATVKRTILATTTDADKIFEMAINSLGCMLQYVVHLEPQSGV